MAFDSHSRKPSSSSVGTRPLGFMARYAGSLFLPNAPPTSMRSCASSSSPTAHITFCTLTEVFRPQTLIMAPPLLAGDGRLVVATNSSLRGGKKQDAPGARAAAANTFKLQNSLFGTIQNNEITAGERFPHAKVALELHASALASGQKKPGAVPRPGSLAQLC